MKLKFGIFDHVDRGDVPMAQYYEERLALIAAYDRLGFYGYHTAEHHATPLGMSPSPSVFLSAAIQRTEKIKVGPLVYTLPLYHPMRLAEEICMLDQMSNGRLQVGVGRGVSPIELGYYGVELDIAQAKYIEAYDVLINALTHDELTHDGRFYKFDHVPLPLRPLQAPHPPIWYGVANPEAADWCVANNVNTVLNGSVEQVKDLTTVLRDRWQSTGKPLGDMPLMGCTRHLFVADTDEAADALAKPAYEMWFASFMNLFRRHNISPRFKVFPESFDEACKVGLVISGSPRSVAEQVCEQVEATGMTYLLARLAFGQLPFDATMKSVTLFAEEVMPSVTSTLEVAA